MAFWRKRQPQPPVVSCYGKLPSTGDFIRHNATAHENTIFDNWLGASIAHAKQSMGDGFLAAYQPTLGIFIYRGDDGDGKEEPERGLVGVWAASGDSAGRHYPMLISTAYDYEQMLSVGPWPFVSARSWRARSQPWKRSRPWRTSSRHGARCSSISW